jgi:hypothetical protein
MKIVRNTLLLLHLAGMAGILISLIKTRTRIATGLLHSTLTATITGIALVGLRYPLHDSDPMKWPLPDNLKVTIKLLFVLIILALAFTNRKKETISSNIWSMIGALTIGNIIIAVVW